MTQLTRRSLLAAAAMSPFTAHASAYAQSSWPSGSIRIVVPFPAGGSVDQMRLWSAVIRDNNIKADI